MAVLQDSDVKLAVAAALKQDAADLPAYWDTVIANAHVSGYQDVLEGLLRRGFTKAQADAWDRCAEFERKMSVYHALLMGASLESFDLTGIKLYDVRKDLERVQVYVSGAYVTPANGSAGPGTVSHGEAAGGQAEESFPPSGFNW